MHNVWKENPRVHATDDVAAARAADNIVCTITNAPITYKVTATVSGKAGEQAENTATVTGGACLASSPCTSTDSDPIVNEPQDAVAVPVDSRTMLVLLALAMVGLAYRQTRRARR